MDYEQLAAHRMVLLDLYKPLCEALDKEEDGVDSHLKKMQENIAAEKFLLAFVGEVKSGKSTFINALLGEAILPYDALQATSEIIEIYKSKKKEVRVTFANGEERVAEDDLKTPENELVPFLRNIAAVKDEYRDIPIVQVNRFLTEHYSEEAGKAEFSNEELDHFIANSNLENPHRLGEEEFAGKIREYIQKNIACTEIPQKIALGYPHTLSELSHFRMVDTPGINAIGGIEEQTKDFLFQADAVVYLHKAGQQESTALRNALENVLPERVKDRLILVLTHRSQSDESAERILEATRSYYPELGVNNVFFVDSLTELYLRESLYCCKSMDEINAIRKTDQKIRRLTADCFEVADGDYNEFLNLLEEQASFDPIRKRIQRDAQNSASIQMEQFAERMKGEYEVLCDRIDAKIKPLKEKYENPQSFALKIQEQKREMETMRRDYNKFIEELREDFSVSFTGSNYYKKLERIVSDFSINIDEKNFDDTVKINTVLDYANKSVADITDEIKNFINDWKKEFQKHIANRNIQTREEYSISIPIISLESIWNKSLDEAKNRIELEKGKIDADKDVWYYVSNIFLGIHYFMKENEKKEIEKTISHKTWEELKSKLPTATDYKTRIHKEVDDELNRFYDNYKKEFNEQFKKRSELMEKLEKDKRLNEDLKEDISHLESKKKRIQESIQRCEKIKGDLG